MISGPGQVDVTCSARIGSRTLLSLCVQILWYDAIHAETPDQLSDECGRREQMLSMQCSILSLPLYNINQLWDSCTSNMSSTLVWLWAWALRAL